jgi:hypothetical protein
MSREFAFCPETATTGEHLWSDWVGKLTGKNNRYLIKREIKGQVLRWKTVRLNEKAPVLCDGCNNVWGSQIESEMKHVVADIVSQSRHKNLSATDIATIAAFSPMKSLVCDYMDDTRKSFYDRRDRHSFRNNLTFPLGVQMWLARTTMDHGVYKAGHSEFPLQTPNRFQIYKFHD